MPEKPKKKKKEKKEKKEMPNYTVVRNRMSSYGEAASLLPKLQAIYRQCQEVDDAITLYQSGSNTDFVTATNAIFTAGERAQLASMLTQVQALTAAWEANHEVLLNAPIG